MDISLSEASSLLLASGVDKSHKNSYNTDKKQPLLRFVVGETDIAVAYEGIISNPCSLNAFDFWRGCGREGHLRR